MQLTSSITQKGQTTIPVSIRRKLGMKPNTKIIFELKNDYEVSIRPVADFFAMKGSIKSDKPFDLRLMEKAVEQALKSQYVKKLS